MARKNPWLVEKTNHTHGQQSENRVIKKLGARPTIASGRFNSDKSDGQIVGTQDRNGYRIEAKATEKKSYSLLYETWKKIHHEARGSNDDPVLTISFTYEDGKPKPQGDLVVISLEKFQELTQNEN